MIPQYTGRQTGPRIIFNGQNNQAGRFADSIRFAHPAPVIYIYSILLSVSDNTTMRKVLSIHAYLIVNTCLIWHVVISSGRIFFLAVINTVYKRREAVGALKYKSGSLVSLGG